MNKFLYAGYGSKQDRATMVQACGRVVLANKGEIAGYKLVAVDGLETLVEEHGAITDITIWQVSDAQLEKLQGTAYRLDDMIVTAFDEGPYELDDVYVPFLK